MGLSKASIDTTYHLLQISILQKILRPIRFTYIINCQNIEILCQKKKP